MSRKRGRNEICWCGSGRKYKHCHLGRGSERRLPSKAIIQKTFENARYRICFHPDASPTACGKISFAHTLQRARVLKSIENLTHHVLTFYPLQFLGTQPKLNRQGWRQASTFEAFCNKHDDSMFAPLEKEPFTGSKEQIFLIGYRAICWELYQKIRMLQAVPTMRALLDQGASLDLQKHIQTLLGTADVGLKIGTNELMRCKAAMEEAYLRKVYDGFDAIRIKISGVLDVAATGAITPVSTLSGAKLQTLHDTSSPLERLTFGVDVESDGASVVFLWERQSVAARRYLEELLRLSDEELAAFLPQFFFGYCENTYFSESWWRNCSSSNQSFVKRLVANVQPYYFPPKFDLSRRLTSWTIVAREHT